MQVASFRKGEGGPGGWWILDEPELHLGPHILVPDLAGWRRERMPEMPDTAYFTLPPDWVCEVLSPGTARVDRADKMPIYAAQGIPFLWLIDPAPHTLEVFLLRAGRWVLEHVYQEDGRGAAPPFDAWLSTADLWSGPRPPGSPRRVAGLPSRPSGCAGGGWCIFRRVGGGRAGGGARGAEDLARHRRPAAAASARTAWTRFSNAGASSWSAWASPQARKAVPPLTVRENLNLGAFTRADKTKVAETLRWIYELFPILAQRREQLAGTLSGGEQQMLAIGRALMANPRILLLDEPSLGLAPLLVKAIFQTLWEINEAGVTIVLVEQNARAALKLAHRGYVMEVGRIVLEDRAEALLANPEVREAYLGGGA